MKVSEYIMDFLARKGVRHVFMVPGGGCMFLVDALGRNKTLQYVSCLHEQSCSFAAEAYGEYTNQLGAALVTTGPGGTNAVTGVAACWVESSPAIFISGQAQTKDMLGAYGVRSMGQQEVDILSIVAPITKYAVTVTNPQSIRYHLEKAVHLAAHGRPGPVWIEVPLDIQSADIDVTRLGGACLPDPHVTGGEAENSLEEKVRTLIEMIQRSRRPVFLVGNGVRTGGAAQELLQLLDRTQIPTLLTWKAMDLLAEEHPCYRGRPGGIGQRFANFTQQNSDCLVVIGARLDLPSLAFDHEQFAPEAKKIVVDVDPAEIFKFRTHIDLAICADTKRFLGEFLKQLDGSSAYNCASWLDCTRNWQVTYPVVLPEYRNKTDYVSTYVLMDELSDLLDGTDLIVPGSAGSCSDILMQAFKVKPGQRVLNAPGLGAMGAGVPGAMGACLAAGGRRTVCVDGDGGFQFNVQELETVRRLNLPIKYFVLNNDGYASIVSSQANHFKNKVGSDPESGLTLPDVKKLATAYGIATNIMRNNQDIRPVVEQALRHAGPVVVEVLVDPLEKTIPRVTSRILDGKVISNSMEDMSPPLDRDELRKVMESCR